jgi:hypothetical protein
MNSIDDESWSKMRHANGGKGRRMNHLYICRYLGRQFMYTVPSSRVTKGSKKLVNLEHKFY